NDRRLRGGIATSFQQDLRSCQISVHYPGETSTAVAMWRRTTALRERIVVAALRVFAVLSVLPIASFASFSALSAMRVGHELTRHVYSAVSDGFASGEPLLPAFAILALALVPSSVQAMTQLLGLDRDSRAASIHYGET
ncbi:hypothetical protein, partial [Nocardia sp. NPDC051570]|uniref:hypothetical protein n=1 Tax=Nocardia sp. NPDC051570 TaxID=3364324 RepID=UPI00378BA779